MSVVDIRTVRLVINVVEKDLRRIHQGTAVEVEVDAYPGENFNGRVARLAPILDPATRTAQVEIEIPNSTYRLKPGMYARARFTVEKHDNALVVPTLAVVDLQGKLGLWMPADEGDTPVFNPVTIGIEQQEFTEITSGVERRPAHHHDGRGRAASGRSHCDGRPARRRQRRAGGGGRGRRGGGAAPGVNANQAQTAW